MIETTQRVEAPVPPDESLPRKGSNVFLWLLALIVLFAAIWFFYNRGASNTAADATTTPVIIGGDAQQDAAQAERDRADATATRKTARAERAKPATRAVKPRIADRGADPIARIKPKYPATAYRNHEEGSVLLRVDVDANGAPGNVSVVRRSGSRDLDNAALAAVRQWRFNPAMTGGKAVASSVEVPVDFRMDEQ